MDAKQFFSCISQRRCHDFTNTGVERPDTTVNYTRHHDVKQEDTGASVVLEQEQKYQICGSFSMSKNILLVARDNC